MKRANGATRCDFEMEEGPESQPGLEGLSTPRVREENATLRATEWKAHAGAGSTASAKRLRQTSRRAAKGAGTARAARAMKRRAMITGPQQVRSWDVAEMA